MRLRVTFIATAAALAMLALPPVHAGEADGEGDGSVAAGSADSDRTRRAAGERGNERSTDRERREASRVGDDLESCKRDADGMRGPERSRFMTQCLKERK